MGHLVLDLSKSRDQVLRIAVVLLVIELALCVLQTDPDFTVRNIEQYDNPLLEEGQRVSGIFIEMAVNLTRAYQKQRDILSGENMCNARAIQDSIDKAYDKYVLLYEGNEINGASHLTRHYNPFLGMKGVKAKYEESFQRLSDGGLGEIIEVKGRNKHLKFKKKPYQEIVENLESADNFPKDISIKEYEEKRLMESKKKVFEEEII